MDDLVIDTYVSIALNGFVQDALLTSIFEHVLNQSLSQNVFQIIIILVWWLSICRGSGLGKTNGDVASGQIFIWTIVSWTNLFFSGRSTFV